MRRGLVLSILSALLLTLFSGATTLAVDPDRPTRPVPAAIDDLRLDEPLTGLGATRPSVLDASLRSATGTRRVVVHLTAESVGEVAAEGGSVVAQRGAMGEVTSQQDAFLDRAGQSVLGRTEVALNAVILEVDAARLTALATDPAVERITPVIDYEYDLPETVPSIGASAVHTAGFTGQGVTVAVLDSGIDYTHAAFGGPGTGATYDAAYGPNTGSAANRDTPTWPAPGTHIVGGFDFVGEAWPFDDEAADPDPIDCGGKPVVPAITGVPTCQGGHGTHVADIIGGEAGVAPDVDLHAVKVCSAVSTSCSGVALLLGMDYALDPDGDANVEDHVDIVNLSLGSPYGQAFDDSLAQAVETASAIGVLTVAASGNSSDKPYVTGTPGAATSALSVAQTAVPSSTLALMEILEPAEVAGEYEAVFQPWSAPLATAIEEPLLFDESSNGRRLGCRLDDDDPATPNPATLNPFPDGSLDGWIVLVERGGCNFSEKIANIALAGGVAGIIGLVTEELPFEGSFGDCQEDACHDIPGFMIAQDISEALQTASNDAPPLVRFDPASGLSLEGTVVGSSSRGPAMLTNLVKPEIAAPGASVSAEAGTATETTPFGGTSGAAPMVSGSAALLMDALAADGRTPAEIKSLLMNYAETEIHNGAPQDPVGSPLAAIQRIGAGEVRVDRSLDGADFAAWDSVLETAALSFGFVDAHQATTTLTRQVTVANYGGAATTFDIDPSFRFADDAANGAVAISAPATVLVPAGGTGTFNVTLAIDGDALREWTASSGSGDDPAPFDLLEYDGYVELTAAGETPLHLAWHVLPRRSGSTAPSSTTVVLDEEFGGQPSGSVPLTNSGASLTAIDGYSLIGESPNLPAGASGAEAPRPDIRYAGVQTIPVDASLCTSEFLLLLAVNTWERQTHANAPASFEWDIDTDGDGAYDWAVFNTEVAGDLSDGRNVVVALNLPDQDVDTALFLTDHATNSSNTVLPICGEQIGLGPSDLGTPLTADLFAIDTYYAGAVTDVITGLDFAPLGERYFPVVGDDGFGSGDVPVGASVTLNVVDFGAAGTNPGELGVLLLGDGSRLDDDGVTTFKTGAPQSREAIKIRVQAAGGPPPSSGLPFTDIGGSPFVNDIVWAYENGVTGGCTTSPPKFCPGANVTREQMASFLDRVLDLPATSADFFADDDSSIHEGAINRLAAAGITGGCGPGRYCPKTSVLRDQMASFLVRAFHLPRGTADLFTDDEGSIHENDINALARSGVTAGCGGTRYCPTRAVTREQMAAFLHRAVKD